MSYTGKIIGRILFAAAAGAAVGFGIGKTMNSTNENILPYSSEIANKDINRLNRINNAISQGEMKNTLANWKNEYNKMMDSLKTDSIAKKAYFDGAQMVRDSIKVAAKIK